MQASAALRDKQNSYSGLQVINGKRITTRNNILLVNSNDCIGSQAMYSAQAYSIANGIRAPSTGSVVGMTGVGIPVVITYSSEDVDPLSDGDTVLIAGVLGNTAANGLHVISTVTLTTFGLTGVLGNGDWVQGTGNWYRGADPGYPEYKSVDSVITGNQMKVKLNSPLRVIRELSIINVSVPRDIIPITVYIPDLVYNSTRTPAGSFFDTSTPTLGQTYIVPNTIAALTTNYRGFFNTPLYVFRLYYGLTKMPDSPTPPPLSLWAPPQGAWPNQPQSYHYQTVPTYVSNTFQVPSGSGNNAQVICSGLGVYDLLDWTSNTGNPLVDSLVTDTARKQVLFALVPTYDMEFGSIVYSQLQLIQYSTTISNSVSPPFGYGDYQRFLPGPGIGQNYQPGSQDGADPTTPGADWTVPFPQFRGNVWGPYDTPGDRFQKMGVHTLVQDLYLNGDLGNLGGIPIIDPQIPTSTLMNYPPMYGLNYPYSEVNLGNIGFAGNPNILNAMRVIPNGFGALGYIEGVGYFPYRQASGMGPSTTAGMAWQNVGVDGGAGTFSYPIASGPQGSPPGGKPQTVDSGTPGTGGPGYRNSWYDLGPGRGQFVTQIGDYLNYQITETPDTNLVIKVMEADRGLRSQCTNSGNGNSMLNVPIRLDIGSNTGTIKYEESLDGALTECGYWKYQYVSPRAKLSELNLTFYAYDGTPIDIEKQLGSLGSSIGFLFQQNILPYDPYSPYLLGRVPNSVQLFFRIQTYDYEHVGMISDEAQNVMERGDIVWKEPQEQEFLVRASNFGNYS